MSMTWQNGRELAALTKTGVNASYAYGEGGLRISKTVNGTETQYCWDGSRLLAQKTGDTWMHFLYDETGSVIGFRYNGGIYIFTKNLQGDIISVVNAFSGETAASYVYDSWGKVVSATGTLAEVNPIRYRGYYYDTETGLYYVSSRYYDPEIGRFINADGIIFTGIKSSNMYAYCTNDPIGKQDSGGFSAQKSIMLETHYYEGKVAVGVTDELEKYINNRIAESDFVDYRLDPVVDYESIYENDFEYIIQHAFKEAGDWIAETGESIWNGIKQIGNDIYEWGSSVDWLGAVDEGLKSAIEGAIAGGCSDGFHGAIIGTISGFVAGFIYYVFDTQQVNKENEGD